MLTQIMVSPQVNEWLCLTCQMQRALTATESVEPPLMKPQASPNKVSTSAAAPKDAVSNQKKDVISTQKADVPDKNQKDTPTPSALQKKEETKFPLQMDITQVSTTALATAKETAATGSVPTKGETTGLPPTNDVPIPTVPPTEEMATPLSHPSKSIPIQAPEVKTNIETSLQKETDLASAISCEIQEVSVKKEEKAEIVQKSTDEPVKPSAEVQPQQAQSKDTDLVEKSTPSVPQPTNQESGGFFGFGSPKSQRAASLTTEAVSGKISGFGPFLFNSASTLITAVQEESRTTPPSSRKMSAPAQVSEKMSASPKSSPPVSPRLTSAKEVKTPAVPKLHVENPKEQPQQAKAPPSGQTEVVKGPSEPATQEAPQTGPTECQSTCPLCKAELNMGSKDLPNYNTCTGCKTTVCNKCGFSPMQNVVEVNKSSNTSFISLF